MPKTDEQLVSEYLAGEKESLEILVKRYLKPVYRFAYKYADDVSEVEDIAQEVFVKAWRALNNFDQARSFKAWLFAIAKNTTLDFLKKKKAIPFSEFESEDGSNFLADTIADEADSPEDIFEKKEKREILAIALKKLSLEFQTVVASRHENDLTFQQIADSCSQSINTVKSRYRRALIALKKSISKD